MAVVRIKPDIYREWLARRDTRRLLALESGWLRDWVGQLHGQHLLYSGIDDVPRFLQRSRLAHNFSMGLEWQRDVVPRDTWMAQGAWPLPDNSVDVVVLQHVLDMSTHPHQIIREAARVIVPNGYLIITGFNPYSLWGAVRWTRTFSTGLPWVSNPVSERRIQDWLTLLDFRSEYSGSIAHTWPVTLGSERISRRVDRVLAGTRWLPASAYLHVARRTVLGMTPIRPRRWQFNDSFSLQPAVGRVGLDLEKDISHV
ncbi:methyltransferase domain-containing protein [Thalassolituus sp. LLYu03]|uniref:methyltransferase domain-containing protein n=1 Tax=Thalassolituus sp. LLYu03 TaxID=3421656 RepID=UPI003D2A3C3F